MEQRKRLTWTADRRASAPPAIPGYGTEDQDHPAHTQDDPAYEQYKKGDPDAWAETPNPPPYPQGNPPATPGYDAEDQDHPAHVNPPRVPKEATFRAQVEAKSAKCVALARHMLGKNAAEDAIGDQALDLMDIPIEQLDSTIGRLGGDFLAQYMEEPLLDESDEMGELDMMLGMEDDTGDDMEAMFGMDDVEACRQADQNDPSGPALAPNPQSEEQERAEGAATATGETRQADHPMAMMFDSYDTDGDTFVTVDDWKGDRAVFAALDTDGDGILARSEVLAAFMPQSDIQSADIMAGLDSEERAMLAEMVASRVAKGDVPPEFLEQQEKMKDKAKDKDEDEDKAKDEDKKDEDKKDEDKKDKKAKDEDKKDEDKKDEDKKDEDKKAGLLSGPGIPDGTGPLGDTEECQMSGMEPEALEEAVFSMTTDPMGLGEEVVEEDEMLAEIFGGRVAKKKAEDEEAEEADEGADDEAKEEDADEKEGGKKKKKAAQRPQPQKPRTGVRTVGQISKAASSPQGKEISELSRLWTSQPDVSDIFGS